MEIIEDSIIEPKPTNETINHEECLWRIKLPNEYKIFIKKFNGSVPKKKSFFCQKKKYAVDRFLCILEQSESHSFGSYDIDVVLTQIEERLTDNEELVGVELLPIVKISSGDYLCLNFKDNKEKPTIILWNNEESGELEPILYKVCESFESFLEMLS